MYRESTYVCPVRVQLHKIYIRPNSRLCHAVNIRHTGVYRSPCASRKGRGTVRAYYLLSVRGSGEDLARILVADVGFWDDLEYQTKLRVHAARVAKSLRPLLSL